MRIATWTIRIAVFLVLLALVAKNADPVTLRFFFDFALQTPLALALFTAFAAGAALGVTAMLAALLRQRREIARLKRDAPPGAAPSPPPVPDL
jgi:uncharacterized integral membrane protein